jgi:type VI secretion system secreted protein VgrG
MHAQKDHLVTVNHNQTGKVGVIDPESGSMGGDQTWTVGGNRSWTVQQGNDSLEIQLGNQTITLDLGQQSVEAMQGINLSVCFGLSAISITPASISMISPVINLTGEAAINLTAPAVNVGAVLNTPALIAGAAVISGIPI